MGETSTIVAWLIWAFTTAPASVASFSEKWPLVFQELCVQLLFDCDDQQVGLC